jgi:hypothetical protein
MPPSRFMIDDLPVMVVLVLVLVSVERLKNELEPVFLLSWLLLLFENILDEYVSEPLFKFELNA